MTDMTKFMEFAKKLDCAGTSNQWMFYDDRFQKFFNFLTTNVTEENILTEHEYLEYSALNGALPDAVELAEQLKELEKQNPGLLDCNSNEVSQLSNENNVHKESTREYIASSNLAQSIKTEANTRLNELENKISLLTIKEKDFFNRCQAQAKRLETLQEENKRLYKDARNCFTKVFSPPLLFCQFPLDQYYPKCDSFIQYLNLYIQENYKMSECLKSDNESIKRTELIQKLMDLKSVIEDIKLKFYEEESKIQGMESMSNIDVSRMSTLNVHDMERELANFVQILDGHLKVANETLRDDLKAHVRQHTQQDIELVLYENTQEKLQRALKRRKTLNGLNEIISAALLNGDLVWICLQLDLNRTHNQIDNRKQLALKSQECWKRIKAMQDLNSTNPSSAFLEVFAELLRRTGQVQNVRCETKVCLYEYEKFCRLLNYEQQNMLNGRAYQAVKEQLKEFERLKSIMKPFIDDSPIKAPVLYNVNLLRPIYNANMNRRRIETSLRQLRTQFQTNIVERMEKEPNWRASQLLWVWFLKQPKRLLMAIEEVKRAAAKSTALAGIKTVSGIKRK